MEKASPPGSEAKPGRHSRPAEDLVGVDSAGHVLARKIGAGRALRAYGRTLAQLKFAILTVMAGLALGFVMNESGQTTTLGLWMAGAGGLFCPRSWAGWA